MDEALWKKIIDELADLKYAGRISFHFYGEPLLDKRIVKFVAEAREKCPQSHIRIMSNGDMLTETFLQDLIKHGLHNILVTNYDEEDNQTLIELSKKYPKHLTYRSYKDFTLKNRAGSLFDEHNTIVDTPCLRPSRQFVINWKGNVLLCCNDYYEEYVMGNVRSDLIKTIWNSKKLRKYQRILSKEGGRNSIPLCQGCNTKGNPGK